MNDSEVATCYQTPNRHNWNPNHPQYQQTEGHMLSNIQQTQPQRPESPTDQQTEGHLLSNIQQTQPQRPESPTDQQTEGHLLSANRGPLVIEHPTDTTTETWISSNRGPLVIKHNSHNNRDCAPAFNKDARNKGSKSSTLVASFGNNNNNNNGNFYGAFSLARSRYRYIETSTSPNRGSLVIKHNNSHNNRDCAPAVYMDIRWSRYIQNIISHFITMKWEILSPPFHVIFTHTQNSHWREHFSLKHMTFLHKISHGTKQALFLYTTHKRKQALFLYTTHKGHFYTTHTFLHYNSQGIFLHNSQRRDIFTQRLTMKGHFYTTTHKVGTFLHQYSSQNGTFLHQYSSQRRDIFTPIQLTKQGHFYTNTAHKAGTFLHQYTSQKGNFLHQYSSQRRDSLTPIQLTEKGHFYMNTAHREGTSLHNSQGTALSRSPQQWRVGQQRWADRLPLWGGSTRPAAWCRCRCWVCPSAASSWTAPPCHRPSTCTQYTVTQVTLQHSGNTSTQHDCTQSHTSLQHSGNTSTQYDCTQSHTSLQHSSNTSTQHDCTQSHT